MILIFFTALSTDKEKMTEEMKLFVDDFFQHLVQILTGMKARHKKELLIHAKLTPERTAKLTPAKTGSTTLSTRDVEDISMLGIEDTIANSSKC